jgi:hypothetical protein
LQIIVALILAIEFVQNNSMTPEHALPLRALGNMGVLLQYQMNIMVKREGFLSSNHAFSTSNYLANNRPSFRGSNNNKMSD